MIDGGSIVTPSYAPYDKDGKEFIIEGRGVVPDIIIENDPAEQYKGIRLINEIRGIIFDDSTISKDNALILGLIEACKMHKIIAKDKSEIKICKRKLAGIIKSDAIAQGVDKVIKEMQAAIIGAVVASTVAATAGSN